MTRRTRRSWPRGAVAVLLLAASGAPLVRPTLAWADAPADARRLGWQEAVATTPATAITLDEAVKRALARNPAAEIAAHEIRRVDALREQVRAGWLPTLNANATYTRLDNDRVLNGRVALAENQLNANLQLSVPLLAPRQWVAYSRSKENVQLARASQADVRRETALATARAYLTVVAQHRVLATAERAFTTAKAHEDYAVTRLQGGVGNRLDAVRAAQERAAAEVRVKTQLTSLARAQEALGVVTGEEHPLDAATDPVLAAAPPIASALSEAEQQRADIAAHRERVEIARKAVRDSWVDYLPMLTAIAQPFYQEPPTFTTPRTGWQAQLVLQLPLFDGGTRYGLAHEREAVESQARARLDGALRQARSDVRIAFDAMRLADEALVGAREGAKLAREALDLAELAYKTGATSNIEVVDAERRAIEAEVASAVAEDAARQARLDFLAACGRFP